jgi:two-component system, response regulator
MTKVILLAEDDPDDAELMQLAFRKADIVHELRVVADGAEAISYLEQHADNPPCLIVLDHNMPRVRGLEVLRWVRENAATSHVPVLMLSSSRLKEEVQEAYRQGANTYFVKPAELGGLVELVEEIVRYWLGHAVHPCFPEEAPL